MAVVVLPEPPFWMAREILGMGEANICLITNLI